ncbi:MAG: (E)-4-hydroxy-3-methylbut-2-enyl-diphosphate synthase [Tenuifilaceae bacterium]
MSESRYCESLSQLKRLKTQVVNIGGIRLGGKNPIRVQTMATTNTNDTESTVDQCIKASTVGSEYFRITAPGVKEAKNLESIKIRLSEKNIQIPLIADIHFNPEAAMEAALHVDKIRINPGNYADRKAKGEKFEYTDEEYKNELIRIEERFMPLINRCKEKNVAMRVGVNHGSLSDRIMSRYGDTPRGMVESAMEFLRICRKHNFQNVVVSMKSSNTRVMVQSTRLLVNCMLGAGMNFPLHLGVTEAGEGEDGRIKSAVGIGTLLADGIGDTIRVSLTEDPECEIPVAKKLVAYFENRETKPEITEIATLPYDPFSYNRRETYSTNSIGGNNPPVVIADLSAKKVIVESDLKDWGWTFDSTKLTWIRTEQSADLINIGNADILKLKIIDDLPLISINRNATFAQQADSSKLNIIELSYNQLNDDLFQNLKKDKKLVILLKSSNTNGFAEQRAAFIRLMENDVKCPVIIHRDYKDPMVEDFQLKSASDLGGLLIDGLGDGIMLTAPNIPSKIICATSFSILQAARTRVSKTEYISCPGCGRTLFNLQETVAKIKAATSHLKGLKIGVMGCIVNGPGEMADADYGYVGSGPGKVSLYKGKDVYKKNIPPDTAVEELINLIKENGDWR